LYYQFGSISIFIELQSALFDEKIQLPKLKDESQQGRILNDIANAYSMSGQPRRAALLFEMQMLCRKSGNKKKSRHQLGELGIHGAIPH